MTSPHSGSHALSSSLQAQLDEITSQTRGLVQPERLALIDAFLAELLASGVEERFLKPGDVAPAFALPDATTGKLVRSTDLLAVAPLVVTFFRGRWCPYCMTEMEHWEASYASIRGRGALLVGISPQTVRQSEFTAQQHGITFPLLSDAHADVAEAFGLMYIVPSSMQSYFRSILVNLPLMNGDPSWRLPLPGTFIVGQDGRIRFAQAFADHRTRPDPADVLALL